MNGPRTTSDRNVLARRLLGLLAVAALLCAAALSPAAAPALAQTVEVIPPSGQWVTDRADLLTDAEERALNDKLRTYEDSTSTQIVIVTIPSLEGVPASEYALELGRSWGVGQEGQDNGVVILVSRDDREVRIETGYGLEGAIPDAVAARIYRNVLVPSFREGQFYAGLSQAVDYLVDAAAGEFTADEIGPQREGEGTFDAATLFVLLIVAFFVINAIRHHRGGGGDGGRRYRRRRHGPPIIIWGGGFGGGHGGGGFGGFGGGGGGFGGFGGGGGSFGGGGAGGGW